MSLLNSFVESIVCVGFSSELGLKIDGESRNDGNLFTSSLQSSLISIVNATQAIYPQLRGNEIIDPCYPPIDLANSTVSTSSPSSSDFTAPQSSLNALTKSQQRNIPAAYNNLPLFCFPDGVRTTDQSENERIHHIVFTQEEGKRIYALALTFQQSFNLKTNKPDDDGIYQIEDACSSIVTPRRRSVSRIPVSITRQKSQIDLKSEATEVPTTSPEPTKTKSTSKKMPKSYPSRPSRSISQTRVSTNSSIDTSQPLDKNHYKAHTISSYMKNLSSTAKPPPTRMIRTNSQNNLASNDVSRNQSSEMRPRSSSQVSRVTPLNSPPMTSTNVTTSTTSSTTTTTSTVVETKTTFYLPHCIVLVSNQPYWTAMHETISMIHDEITRLKIVPNSTLYKKLIQKYAFLACNTPIPPVPWERFSLSFSLTNDRSVLTFDPPIDTNHTVLDLDLSILPLTLNIGKLLDVLSAIFLQQPIIFFSSNYSKLVTTLECLLYLIYPLKWFHVYVPFVPDGLRDYYLEGPPGSYIMGAHSRHQSIVDALDMSFTCNLDNDKNIHIPKDIEFHTLPATKIQRFVGRLTEFLENIKVSRSLQNVHIPARFRIDQQREYERKQRIETNHKIIQIFLDLMIDLCGDALKPIYWKVNHSQLSPTNTLTRTQSNDVKSLDYDQTKTVFSKEKYLLSKSEGVELEFYRLFVETTAFQQLVEEEMRSKSSTVFRRICQLHSSSDENQFYHFNHVLSIEHDDSNNYDNNTADTTLYDSLSSQMLLPLPNWPANTSAHYLDSCIDLFTSELHNAQQEHATAIAEVYAYLRGCALLARGHYLDGLRDLYSIQNPDLFPLDYIETIVLPNLSQEFLLDIFINEPFYTSAPGWKKVLARQNAKRMSIIDLEKSGSSLDETRSVQLANDIALRNEWLLIENKLTYEQFSGHVQGSSIVLDKETTQKLFNALLYWADSTLTKTLKKDKTLPDTTNKPSETIRPPRRRFSLTDISLKETFDTIGGRLKGTMSGSGLSKSSANHSNSTLPLPLFELFLDNWQRTNAEKVRMNRYLPEDRQKKESILKMSSSGIVSKADGPGKLILTQKRLYFLPEVRSFARLLTELMNITSVEKYQHQTVFSSSKPGIKIHTSSSSSTSSLPRDNNKSSLPRDTNPLLKTKSLTSSSEKETKSSIRLFFKNNQEQELWHTIIVELWSGLIIAHEQCDTAILNKASRHIVLMDTLSHINYFEEAATPGNKQAMNIMEKQKESHNEASLEMALNELSTFTKMRRNGSFKPLSAETRHVLTRRLSPSINEISRHAVRCVLFTEHREHGRSSLWCAYGSKLKVYNGTTWICDPTDILFPSLITCMCLDSRNKLWVGCIDGQLYVVDTLTHVCGSQLASIIGDGGCQTITFNENKNQILTGSRSGSIIIWNASNWERITEINLCELYRASTAQQDKTFVSTTSIQLRPTTQTARTENKKNRKLKLFSESKQSVEKNDLPDMPIANGPKPIIPSSIDKLERIQTYQDLLFASYRDNYIISFRISESNTYSYEHIVSVKYKTDDSTPLDAFLVYNEQLWISAGCIISIFSVNEINDDNSYSLLMKKPVDDDSLITMLGFSGYMWAGSLRGNVYVFRMDNYELLKTFAGHHDSVCCLCSMLDTYVISGSSQNDSSVAIWENIQTSVSATNSITTETITSASGTLNALKTSRKQEMIGEGAKSIDVS